MTWTIVAWLRLPDVPVIVSVYVPARVPEEGFAVSEAVLVTPAYDAEMVTGVEAFTALVFTVKLALLAP
jgi:hypothetical protein